MRNRQHFILMADIIDSRKAKQATLMEQFRTVISTVNKKAKTHIISPLTITLGDEFQGIVTDLKSGIDVIIQIEEAIINAGALFELRYVLLQGAIETPINRKIAHAMLGGGLTEARNMLADMKNSTDRFFIKVNDEEQSDAINNAFRVYQSVVADWQPAKDYEVVSLFLQHKDYKIVADELNKDRSLLWRREKSIKLKEYLSLKAVLHYLSKQ